MGHIEDQTQPRGGPPSPVDAPSYPEMKQLLFLMGRRHPELVRIRLSFLRPQSPRVPLSSPPPACLRPPPVQPAFLAEPRPTLLLPGGGGGGISGGVDLFMGVPTWTSQSRVDQ